MRQEIKTATDEFKKESFPRWMLLLAVTLFSSLFGGLVKLNIDINRDFQTKQEARQDITEIKSDMKAEFIRLNNKVDQLLQSRIRP